MKVLKRLDAKLVKIFGVLCKTIYLLAGKDNFWLARKFFIATFVPIGIMIVPGMPFGIKHFGFLAFLGLFLMELSSFYMIFFTLENWINTLEKDARRSATTAETHALDEEAVNTKEACKLLRFPAIIIFVLLSGIFIYGILTGRILMIHLILIFGFALWCLGVGIICYLITIDSPPKRRFKIKDWLKSLLPEKQGVLAPIPVPNNN